MCRSVRRGQAHSLLPTGIQVAAAEQAGRVTYYERADADTGAHHRFRFISEMPLNASNADLRVNKATVYRLMQGARARWRIENETCNTLKNQGYHFEHNFGHGSQHLSVVFAVLMMLAFFVEQTQQRCCPLFQAAWATWGSKRLLWEKMRALFDDYALESMQHLCAALLYGLKKSAPVLDVDSSSSTSRLKRWVRSDKNGSGSPQGGAAWGQRPASAGRPG